MKTEHWIKQIDQTTDDFKHTFGSLTDEQMNRKPDEQSWSIAQNIDHLIVINESYYPILDAIHNGTYKTPFIGKFGFVASFMGKMLLQHVQPDRSKKTKTFTIWEPDSASKFTGILQKFENHQEELKKQIENSEDLLEQGTVIASPANKNIAYKLETAFDIITTHEQRHFEQAKEVLNSHISNTEKDE